MQRDVEALLAFLEQRLPEPHAWGRRQNDCGAFNADAVEAQTGIDPAAGLDWIGPVSGLRLLKRMGGFEAILDARFERVPPSMAMRGDIAGVAHARLGIHPMIVDGAMLAGPGDRGIKRLPRRAMVMAWSVVKPKRPPASPHANPAARGRRRAARG